MSGFGVGGGERRGGGGGGESVRLTEVAIFFFFFFYKITKSVSADVRPVSPSTDTVTSST